MRIIFQYYSGGGGGLSNIILLLKAYLREFPDDHIVVVCSENSDLMVLSEFNNVEIVALKEGQFKELARCWLGFVGLRFLAHRYRGDVVWSLNLGAYISTGVPSVLSLNNAHQVYPWEVTRFHPRSRVRVALLRLFFRLSARAANGVLVQTPLMGKYVSQIRGAPRKICVVPKAVEKQNDVYAENLPQEISQHFIKNNFNGVKNWLYVATFMPHKNHAVIIKAFHLLHKRGSKARLILTISAKDVVQCGGEVANELLQAGVIIPLGWVAKNHLRALYDECDACLMPSILESLSSSHLEAMEWGRPQVVSDLPYARDLCGDAAFYVAPHSEKEWADAIDQINGDELLASRLIKLGRSRIQEFPGTWSECAKQVRAFLVSTKNPC